MRNWIDGVVLALLLLLVPIIAHAQSGPPSVSFPVSVAQGGTGATTAANARTALGVTATGSDTTYASRANNLSDLGSAATARTNLGLAASATTDTTNASNISSGTLGAARLPAPTATTLGGVESYASPANQFLTSISPSGTVASTQPSCTNLSNAAASCATDATNATNISSGTLAQARLPTNATAQSSGSSTVTAPNSTSAFTMAGLAASVTPTKSGKVLIVITGYIVDSSSTTVDVGLQYKIAFGTGTAPLSNATATGTVAGSVQKYTAPVAPTAAADVAVPFSIAAVVTGLTVNTAAWIDLQQEAITTASQYGFSNVSVSIIEL